MNKMDERIWVAFDTASSMSEEDRVGFLYQLQLEDTKIFRAVLELLKTRQPNPSGTKVPSELLAVAWAENGGPFSGFPPTSDPAPEEVPPVEIPGHVFEGWLGKGGMGVVYLARQLHFDRLVAVKMILSQGSLRDELRTRFRTEVRAVARLNHPAIVQVYETGECKYPSGDSVPFLTMEYCPGGSLSAQIDGVPQSPQYAASVAEILARGVHVAHENGVIHRDLKPANVLLNANNEPKITDFGLAKTLDTDLHQTQTGAIMGSPSYLAPEQANGTNTRIGPATDVYGVGAILYEMLTGQPPFKGTNLLETMDQVRYKEPVPPRQLQPRIPEDLQTICLKCLRKEPSQRYASALSLANDLLAFRENSSISARPDAMVERASQSAKRHKNRYKAFFVGISLLLGLLFFGYRWWANNESPNPPQKKPTVAHKEPAVAHKEPAVAHKEPAVAQKKPAAAQQGPAAVLKKPAAAKKKPTIVCYEILPEPIPINKSPHNGNGAKIYKSVTIDDFGPFDLSKVRVVLSSHPKIPKGIVVDDLLYVNGHSYRGCLLPPSPNPKVTDIGNDPLKGPYRPTGPIDISNDLRPDGKLHIQLYDEGHFRGQSYIGASSI